MKTVNFKPLNDYVLVELPKIAEQTTSGLIKTPEQINREKEENTKDDYLTIVAVATDVKSVKLGQRVLVNLERMQPIKVDGIIYGLISSGGLLGFEDIHTA